MTKLYITNNKLEPIDHIVPLGGVNNTITVVVKAPIQSHVYMSMDINGNYSVPMYFSNTTKDGNEFSAEYIPLVRQIDYLKQHTNKIIEVKFVVNGVEIEGILKCTIATQLLYTMNNSSTEIYNIKNKLEELNSQIKVAQIKAPTFETTEQILQKGMIPIATGLGNSYVWDMPFDKLTSKVTELTQLVIDLSSMNKKLTERLSTLENRLNDHLYEEYNL